MAALAGRSPTAKGEAQEFRHLAGHAGGGEKEPRQLAVVRRAVLSLPKRRPIFDVVGGEELGVICFRKTIVGAVGAERYP